MSAYGRDLGDGPPCPENVMHGNTYDMAVCWWCPVDGTRFAKLDDWTAGERLTRAPAAPMLRSATQHAARSQEQP